VGEERKKKKRENRSFRFHQTPDSHRKLRSAGVGSANGFPSCPEAQKRQVAERVNRVVAQRWNRKKSQTLINHIVGANEVHARSIEAEQGDLCSAASDFARSLQVVASPRPCHLREERGQEEQSSSLLSLFPRSSYRVGDASKMAGRFDKLVVVFDFDWSLINENSDTYIFKQLAESVYEMLCESAADRPGQWTEVVDEALVRLQVDEGVDKSEIRSVLESVPHFPEMVEVVKLVGGSPGGEVHILSDANEFFIHVFLEKHGLSDFVTTIQSNRSFFDEVGTLRVKPFQSTEDPHECEMCPMNLCKGGVLETLDILRPGTKVLYVGDGSNDFCPALRLRKEDELLMRADPDHPQALGLSKRIEANAEDFQVLAKINAWTSGAQVLDCVREAFDQVQRISNY